MSHSHTCRDKTGADSVTSFWRRVWFGNIASTPGQQPSVAGVYEPIRVLQKDVTESAPVFLRRAHACETQKPPP